MLHSIPVKCMQTAIGTESMKISDTSHTASNGSYIYQASAVLHSIIYLAHLRHQGREGQETLGAQRGREEGDD